MYLRKFFSFNVLNPTGAITNEKNNIIAKTPQTRAKTIFAIIRPFKLILKINICDKPT